MPDTKLMRTKWFPNPHTFRHIFGFALESGVENRATNYPICMYDEGQGTPSDLETNPVNAAFVVDQSPMIYPDSRVDSIFAQVTVSMTKAALETDKLHAIRYFIQPVHMAFLEDYTAIDDLSSTETQDAIEMQTESTDRQGIPLWNNIKLPAPLSGKNLLHADVPLMDTTQQIEGITYGTQGFYNAIHYMTIANKLKTLTDGIRWHIIKRQNPVHVHRFRIHRSSKHANPYMYAGLIIGCPAADAFDQIPMAAETTNVTHLKLETSVRYNEWNENFNFKPV